MNFTKSEIWNNSIILRYPLNEIKKIDSLIFHEENNILKCQHFFDFDISLREYKKMSDEINDSKKIRFNYLDSSALFKHLKKWAINNNYTYQIIDKWKAPRLILKTDVKEYLEKNIHSQIKRNYKKYQKSKNNYIFYNSSSEDTLKLWNYVLEIDNNSWKKQEKSDMKSLNREDLQYLPFLLSSNNSSLIVVCDSQNNPLAYSLMFKNNNNYWYAVKWGASNIARKNYVGIFCLFYHLEYLYYLNQSLEIDFWGRRNNIYDSLKNDSIDRMHVLIYKEG